MAIVLGHQPTILTMAFLLVLTLGLPQAQASDLSETDRHARDRGQGALELADPERLFDEKRLDRSGG